MPPSNASPLPTDKSMCPGKMMSSIPIASVALSDSSTMRFDKLRGPRNSGARKPKNAEIAMSSITSEKSRMVSLDSISDKLDVLLPHRRSHQFLLRGF